MASNQGKRKRGVILSADGIQRLNRAIAAAEVLEKEGDRFTLEELSDRSGISNSTISRLWTSKTGVDRRTLRMLFSAFQLDLTDTDIQPSGEDGEPPSSEAMNPVVATPKAAPMRYPSGPVPLNSTLYLCRPGIDDRAMQEITQPGCVIRIKAPRGFGKTSLLHRILQQSTQLCYSTVQLDLQQAEPGVLEHPTGFLRWFCTVVSIQLGIQADLESYWDQTLGSTISATVYVQEAILTQIQRPLVLSLNEVNRIFEYPETAKTIFPLLRSWHEEAQHNQLWQNLRLVVAYSTDAYLPLDINQSPFNIGLPLLLPEFTCQQMMGLATLYHVQWTPEEGDRLFSLIGGHPFLVGIALYHLSQGMALDDMLDSAATHDGIFRHHLQQMLADVTQMPQWSEALRPLLSGEAFVPVAPILAYQLEGLGLITSSPQGWALSCELYRRYFKRYLLLNESNRAPLANP
jgi:transcriptional regulator with XRE-family HTH domain